MASGYSAGQYEDAFSPSRLQHWSVARPSRKRPSLREGSTRIIANDQGHLLPSEPRSQASPWGTFMGTWEMPSRIPPARLDLSSRSATAAARLTEWVLQPTALTRACNGLHTDITSKPQEPRSDTQTVKEPSRRRAASSKGIRLAGVSPGVQLQEPSGPGAGVPAEALFSHDPSCRAPASLPKPTLPPACGDRPPTGGHGLARNPSRHPPHSKGWQPSAGHPAASPCSKLPGQILRAQDTSVCRMQGISRERES